MAPDRSFQNGEFSLAELIQEEIPPPLRLTRIALLDAHDICVPYFHTGKMGKFSISFEFREPNGAQDLEMTLTLLNRRQQPLTVCRNIVSCKKLPSVGKMICSFPRLPIMPGQYKIRLKYSLGKETPVEIPASIEFIVAKGDYYPDRPLPPPGSCDSLFDHNWATREG